MPNYKSSIAGLFRSRASLGVTATTAIVAGLLFSAQTTIAQTQTKKVDEEPNYVMGLYLGSFGIGASINVKTDWSLIAGDQIQWRTSLSGIDIDGNSDDDIEYNDVDYNNIEGSLYALKTGVDWYPYQSGWAEKVYFSAGMLYLDSDFEGSADTSKTFNVGGVTVQPGDIDSLNTSIEQSGILPYLSVGWGNKLDGRKGFDFQAEIGLAYQASGAKVGVTAVDLNNFLTDANLSAEANEIDDDISDIQGFASITVSYRF